MSDVHVALWQDGDHIHHGQGETVEQAFAEVYEECKGDIEGMLDDRDETFTHTIRQKVELWWSADDQSIFVTIDGLNEPAWTDKQKREVYGFPVIELPTPPPPMLMYFTAERYNNSLKTVVFLTKEELEEWTKTWEHRQSMIPEFLERIESKGVCRISDIFGIEYSAERRIWNGSEWEAK